VAVLRWPDGRTKPLLFDGSPLLLSAVYVDDAGRLVVGRDAMDSARLHPSRLEPNPKRRIDEGAVLLGDVELPVEDLIGAVLRLVAAEARRVAGVPPAVVTLTCPAAWGSPRQRVLLAAAARAGLGEVRLVEEPVAAATYFAGVLGRGMAVGTAVVVYGPVTSDRPSSPDTSTPNKGPPSSTACRNCVPAGPSR
jgi:molecular chaperone DnaK (HSP70)